MADREEQARLVLTVSPAAERGGTIIADVEASNVPETVVELSAPDTVVVSPPHRQVVGAGTFKRQITWRVEHVQRGARGTVEITATAGPLVQIGLCRIVE